MTDNWYDGKDIQRWSKSGNLPSKTVNTYSRGQEYFINTLFIIIMKKTFFMLMVLAFSNALAAHSGPNFEASDIFKTLGKGDKVAILMVHFGTTHADTRALTIDAINEKVKEEFPNVEFCEAYTSRIVVKRLGERGIQKMNASQALEQLKAEGYTHILIQATCIIDGVEMEALNNEVDQMRSSFKEIRIGDPLLYSPHDYENVIEVLAQKKDTSTAYIWIGHGTYDSSTAQYAMLDYMLKSKGYNNYFVATIEGYPEFDDVLMRLNSMKAKKVVLVPFLFVAGEHAKNDIAEDWKSDLEEKGFAVDVHMEGLGQNPAIQDLFISHLKFISHHRKIGIMKKKAIYEVTGEKMK